MTDPIITAIEAFGAGIAAYNATPNAIIETMEQQVIDATYGPPLDVLSEWTAPAVTMEGALAAIRFAAKELSDGGADIAERMIHAAITYFDGGANV